MFADPNLVRNLTDKAEIVAHENNTSLERVDGVCETVNGLIVSKEQDLSQPPNQDGLWARPKAACEAPVCDEGDNGSHTFQASHAKMTRDRWPSESVLMGII